MSLVNDIDEYGFKRSEEEIQFIANEKDYFTQITRNSIEINNYLSNSNRTTFLFKKLRLKRIVRKGNYERKSIVKINGSEK
jgi:hypothetical protein